MSRRSAIVAWAVIAIASVVVPSTMGNYDVFVLQRLLQLFVLALGLNLFQGYCGQANFGVSGFVAVGAYSSGILETKLHVHPFLTFVPAMLLGALCAYLLSFIVVRLRAMSQAIGTVAFALTVYSLLNTAVPGSWGGGDQGFSLAPVVVFGVRLRYLGSYFVMLVLAVLVFVACVLVVRSPIGRAWTAIREDETAAASSGIDVTRFMRLAFVLNGAIAAVGGVMLTMESRFISPDNFTLSSNVLILLAVVVGGQGSNVGMLVGAVMLVAIGEYVADLQDFPTLIYGLILFVVIRFLPRGVWPHLRDGAGWLRRRLPDRSAALTPRTAPTVVRSEGP